MKFLFFISLIIVSVFSSSFLSVSTPNLSKVSTTQDIIDFSIGFLLSIQAIEKIPSGFPCVTQATNFEQSLKNAISKLETLKYSDMVEGFSLLIKTVNDTVLLCGATAHEGNVFFSDIFAKLENSTFIQEGVKRIEDNVFNVLEDLSKGVADFKNHSYFNAGTDFGKIAEIFLVGLNRKENLEEENYF